MKTTLFEKLMIFFGHKYLLNTRSNEVHQLTSLHKNCGVRYMVRKNKRYITEEKKEELFKAKKANGCRWCYKSHNVEP